MITHWHIFAEGKEFSSANFSLVSHKSVKFFVTDEQNKITNSKSFGKFIILHKIYNTFLILIILFKLFLSHFPICKPLTG